MLNFPDLNVINKFQTHKTRATLNFQRNFRFLNEEIAVQHRKTNIFVKAFYVQYNKYLTGQIHEVRGNRCLASGNCG